MSDAILLHPIGMVRGGRDGPLDDSWGGIEARIELDSARLGPDAALGLADFSHVEVIFHFDRVAPDTIQTDARHPRERSEWPRVGILAQRGKARPNRLGVTICELVSVQGTTLHVRGLDAIDGTPVIDIKPVMKGFLPRGEIKEPAWASELMKHYW